MNRSNRILWMGCAVLLVLLAVCGTDLFMEAEWTLVAQGFQFPEGPAWSSDGVLYVSNCNGGWIARIQGERVDTLVSHTENVIQKTNGLLLLRDGRLLACDFGLGAILAIEPSGQVSTLIPGYRDQPFNRPNDLTIDVNGHLYFTDPKSYGSEKTDGRIFYYNTEIGELLLAEEGLAFPNGIAISPKDNKLYVSESAKSRILRYRMNPDGTLSGQEVFIVIEGGDPDGLEFDARGNLYVAHFGSGTVFVISPGGRILRRLEAPGRKPSNLEFGGNDKRMLYLTEDETNSVYRITTRHPGRDGRESFTG